MNIIDWVKVGTRNPTDANTVYEGRPDSPFIACLVYSHMPDYPKGGIIVYARWDSKAAQFLTDSHWVLQSPYVISHFIETHHLNKPE